MSSKTKVLEKMLETSQETLIELEVTIEILRSHVLTIIEPSAEKMRHEMEKNIMTLDYKIGEQEKVVAIIERKLNESRKNDASLPVTN